MEESYAIASDRVGLSVCVHVLCWLVIVHGEGISGGPTR